MHLISYTRDPGATPVLLRYPIIRTFGSYLIPCDPVVVATAIHRRCCDQRTVGLAIAGNLAMDGI